MSSGNFVMLCEGWVICEIVEWSEVLCLFVVGVG